MLNLRENMIVIDGQIKTDQIMQCTIKNREDKYDIIFNNSPHKTYSYSKHKVKWMTTPILFKPEHCHIYYNNNILQPLSYIAAFQQGFQQFWYLEYPDGTYASYQASEIIVLKSCLDNKQAKNSFEYLRSVAAINSLKSEDDNLPLLLQQYQNVDFIGNDSAAAVYLNPDDFQPAKYVPPILIYPFGCNASQQKAVQLAFSHQLSIIQGPPGTGKTQTILNIIANILTQGKSVMVVSNNNSALTNVIEKLKHHEMDFITALLGNRKNKEDFIAAQKNEKIIPECIKQWHDLKADQPDYLKTIDVLSATLADIFSKQERLALARQQLEALKVEATHFQNEIVIDEKNTLRKPLSSTMLMELWQMLQDIVEKDRYSGIFSKLYNAIKNYFLSRRLHKIFSGISHIVSMQDITFLIPIIQQQFYTIKQKELMTEITKLEKTLASVEAEKIMQKLQNQSMGYLRNALYKKYGKKHKRPIFTLRSMGGEMINEYPIILSTTFSSRTNFHNDVVFDYVIMDEASQISSETGVLALMCAQRAVIVGDSMQLPNVITEEDKVRLQAIAINNNIDERYDCAKNSFLQSVCRVLPNAPQTLLREHYRCHPKIINFCNQKFYGGKLIIMTKDNGEPDVITAKRTVKGYHARDKMNLREIEVIAHEILPTLKYPNNEIGLIVPYNNQAEALRQTVEKRFEVDTVHKFQGREKDVIVMSTVDDIIKDFSDDPNLLNVAISRAKKRFCLVVSGNEQPKDCNISDLLAYIEYNNCTVSESNIHSVFDLLYDSYTDARKKFLQKHKRISEYDSENLTYAMLENLLNGNVAYSHLGIICHQPLRQLLRDVSLLNDEDKSYALHPATHIDFLLYNRVSKQPVLAIETDGYKYHKSGTRQSIRDSKKNRILKTYNIPLLRLSTIGSEEQKRVETYLARISNPSFIPDARGVSNLPVD